MTRIVITGLLAATTPAQRRETVVAFEEALLTDELAQYAFLSGAALDKILDVSGDDLRER